MTFDATTTFAEGLAELDAMPSARAIRDERGGASRKHVLDAYAEHLEALKRGREKK
jgi:hypothetical protein